MSKVVLDVGQCDYDHSRIKQVLKSCGALVERACGDAKLSHVLQHKKFDLILFNRIFDRDGQEALNVIRKLKEENILTAPFMLVSNYPDAQAQALAFGALPGFGKQDLNDPSLVSKLNSALS